MPNPTIPAAGGAMPAPRLAELFADPFLRRAFRRAERDGGRACAVPAHGPKPTLADGAVALPKPALEASHR